MAAGERIISIGGLLNSGRRHWGLRGGAENLS
jgi:hypothetical protein